MGETTRYFADGALQYVLLPMPFRTRRLASRPRVGSVPLMVDHEIVSLPSASTLVVVRRETSDRALAPNLVAVLADPVFDGEDVRVRRAMADAKGSRRDPREQAKDSGLFDC